MFLDHYFTHKLKFSRFLLWQPISIQKILTILLVIVVFSPSAVASSLDGYCISKVGRKKKRQLESIAEIENKLPTNFVFPPELPELYTRPCTVFGRFFGNCDLNTYFSYSTTLDRVFIQGHRETFLGPDFISLEVTRDRIKPDPELIALAGFVGDIPQWNGALFQNSSGDALFYDGVTVTNLSKDFCQLERGEEFKGWSWQKTIGGREFLARYTYPITAKNPSYPLFIMELEAQPGFKPIFLPKTVQNTWLELFTLKNDSRLWGITGNSILAEVGGRLKTVATIPKSFLMNVPRWESTDGSILFDVLDQNNTELTTSFFLRQASPTANCEVMLDADKPVSLEPELNNQ
jgi:hypothetical protein